MFRLCRSINSLAKPFLCFQRNYQVCVVGGSSPVGQSLSLLLKEHSLINRLTLYDKLRETYGIAMDVSHIPSKAHVEGWSTDIKFPLRGTDIVVLTSDNPRIKDQTDYEIFKENANSIITSVQNIAAHCPNAFVVVATEPINYTVPLICNVFESCDVYNKAKVLGVTGVDVLRTQMLISSTFGENPVLVSVPVVCGHSSTTMVPLFSQITPHINIDNRIAISMTECIRNFEKQVVHLKGGTEFSNFSTAYATFKTVLAILDAMNGYVVEHVAYVANNNYDTKYFASPLIIKAEGITSIKQYKEISALEADYIRKSIRHLAKDVHKAESYYIFTNQMNRSAGPKFIKTL